MRDLQYIIGNCFQLQGVNHEYTSRVNTPSMDDNTTYMKIPTSNDDFEIPVLALGQLNRIDAETDLVIILKYVNTNTTYKALDTGLRDAMCTDFDRNRLVKLPVKTREPTYYGTYGAIFDKDFMPIVLLLWEVRKVYDDKGNLRCKFIRPILRVHPSVFINKSNSVERYIINKLIPAALGNTYIYKLYLSRAFNDEQYRYTLSVEIGEFSFKMSKPGIPSISTTNESLLKVALNNIDELVS